MMHYFMHAAKTFGTCELAYSRNFDRNPMVKVSNYRAANDMTEDGHHKVIIEQPCVVVRKAFHGADIGGIEAPRVVFVGEEAFAHCTHLSDLSGFRFTPSTIVEKDCFFHIGWDDDVDIVKLPPMTEEQIKLSGVWEGGPNTLRRDVWFSGADDATCDALSAIGLPTIYSDGRNAGFPIKILKKFARMALLQLDARGGGSTFVEVCGKALRILDEFTSTDGLLDRSSTPYVIVDSFIGEEAAIEIITKAMVEMLDASCKEGEDENEWM